MLGDDDSSNLSNQFKLFLAFRILIEHTLSVMTANQKLWAWTRDFPIFTLVCQIGF
jgi:hypothetical protein